MFGRAGGGRIIERTTGQIKGKRIVSGVGRGVKLPVVKPGLRVDPVIIKPPPPPGTRGPFIYRPPGMEKYPPKPPIVDPIVSILPVTPKPRVFEKRIYRPPGMEKYPPKIIRPPSIVSPIVVKPPKIYPPKPPVIVKIPIEARPVVDGVSKILPWVIGAAILLL